MVLGGCWRGCGVGTGGGVGLMGQTGDDCVCGDELWSSIEEGCVNGDVLTTCGLA